MQEEGREWDCFMIYDSSGLQIYNQIDEDIEIFMDEQDFKIPANYNLTTSVGQYIDEA